MPVGYYYNPYDPVEYISIIHLIVMDIDKYVELVLEEKRLILIRSYSLANGKTRIN
jgi:hypothetical protein